LTRRTFTTRMSHPQRCLLRIAGPEAVKFLQGLCTSDVLALERVQATAFLTTKGRVLADAFLWRTKDDAEAIFVDCAKSQETVLLRHLKMYRLRSKVEIGSCDLDFGDPGLPLMGLRDDRRRRLAAGVGQAEEIAGRVPLTCNLDLLGHVSFSKGCYLGQELTARAFHRGTVRKRIYPVAVVPRGGEDDFGSRPTVDDVIAATAAVDMSLDAIEPTLLADDGGADVGTLVASDGPVGIAVLGVDFVKRRNDIAFDDSFVLRPFHPTWWPTDL